MKIDKNTLLTIIFTLVADIMKEPNIATQLRRPGPDPDLTDAEVITVGLYQELIGKSREDHFFRLHEHELRQYFPLLNERSRYNRRKRDLHRIFLAVRIALGMVLGTKEMKTVAIDSAPVPVVGYKRDKRQTPAGFVKAGAGMGRQLDATGISVNQLGHFGIVTHGCPDSGKRIAEKRNQRNQLLCQRSDSGGRCKVENTGGGLFITGRRHLGI